MQNIFLDAKARNKTKRKAFDLKKFMLSWRFEK